MFSSAQQVCPFTYIYWAPNWKAFHNFLIKNSFNRQRWSHLDDKLVNCAACTHCTISRLILFSQPTVSSLRTTLRHWLCTPWSSCSSWCCLPSPSPLPRLRTAIWPTWPTTLNQSLTPMWSWLLTSIHAKTSAPPTEPAPTSPGWPTPPTLILNCVFSLQHQTTQCPMRTPSAERLPVHAVRGENATVMVATCCTFITM